MFPCLNSRAWWWANHLNQVCWGRVTSKTCRTGVPRDRDRDQDWGTPWSPEDEGSWLVIPLHFSQCHFSINISTSTNCWEKHSWTRVYSLNNIQTTLGFLCRLTSCCSIVSRKILAAGLFLTRLILLIPFTGLLHRPPRPNSTPCVTQPWCDSF